METRDIDASRPATSAPRTTYALRRHGTFSKAMRHGVCQSACICLWWALAVFGGLCVFAMSVRFSRGNDPATSYFPRFSGVRLPGAVSPTSYSLFLRVDPAAKIFTGNVRITVDVLYVTNRIALHADPSLAIHSFKWGHVGQPAVDWPIVKRMPAEQMIYGQQASLLPLGKTVLHLEFSGVLQDQILEGLYLSTYRASSGALETLVVSQFEPTAARRMFPCFDEPAYKAEFSLVVSAPGALTVLSNMPVASTEADTNAAFASAGYRQWTFAPTPKMSSYLVAVAVGKFDFLEATSDDGALVRAYTPVGQSAHAAVALDTAKRALTVFRDLFDTPFMLPKLDLVALPSFAPGAIENFGLLMFRSSRMLIDATASSQLVRQELVRLVCREVAHQWAGNYVTMSWWDNLWLNVGLATFLQYECVDRLHPEWSFWDRFPEFELPAAFVQGAFTTAHPLYAHPNNFTLQPSQIPALFDVTTSAKGAALFRMVQALTASTPSTPGVRSAFYLGLSDYFDSHAFGTGTPAALWKALAAHSSFNVARFMSPWISVRGYPVVTVQQEPLENDAANVKLTLTQQRFNLVYNVADDAVFWPVPVRLSGPDGALTLFSTAALSINAPKAPDVAFFVLNADRESYHRTNYSVATWALITQTIATTPLALGAHVKSAMLDDAMAFYFAAQFPVETAMRLFKTIAATAARDDYSWITLARDTVTMLKTVRATPSGPTSELDAMRGFVRRAIEPVLAGVALESWLAPLPDTMPVAEQLGVTAIMQTALLVGHPGAIAAAMNVYNTSKFVAGVVSPLVEQSVLDVAAQSGAWAELEAAFLAAHAAGNDARANVYLRAMAAAREEFNLRNTIAYAMRYDSSGRHFVQPADFPALLIRMAGSLYGGREIAYQYVTTQWDAIRDVYGKGGSIAWGRIVLAVFGQFDTELPARAAAEFLATRTALFDPTYVQQVIETNQALLNFRMSSLVPSLAFANVN